MIRRRIFLSGFHVGVTNMSENLGTFSESSVVVCLFPSFSSIRRCDSIAFSDAFPFLYVRIEQWGSN